MRLKNKRAQDRKLKLLVTKNNNKSLNCKKHWRNKLNQMKKLLVL